MFVLIGLAVLAIYGLLVFYIGWSGWSWMRPKMSRRFKVLYIVLLVFLSTSFIFGRFLGSFSLLSIIGNYWLAVFSLLLIMLPIVHLCVWLSRLTRLPRHHTQKWAGWITLTALIALIGYGSFNAYSPVVREYTIEIDKPVQGLQELRVVMAADMHFGLLSGPSHARRMVEEINALQPDLVIYPGDIIDDDLEAYERSGIPEIIAGVEAPMGVYASLGNHDKFDGPIEDLVAALERSGMEVLYDDVVSVEDKLTLIGRRDRTEPERRDVSALVAEADASQPLILIDHQPYELGVAADNGIDLMLSGHTHRGQIAPAHLITRALYENDWGHLQKGSFHSVVTSGYGFWGPPIRIGSRSEIVLLTLRFTG